VNRDEIIKMAREAQQESFVGDTGHWFKMEAKDLERFFHMAQAAVIEQGYRKCAEGQKTTQFCGMLEQAMLAEREACAKVCDLALLQCQEAINELDETEHIAQCFVQGAMTQLVKLSKAIRARGQA
jgi:hypothetical protein